MIMEKFKYAAAADKGYEAQNRGPGQPVINFDTAD